VESLKYTIWSRNKDELAAFYQRVFNAEIVRENDAVTEVAVGGGRIAIHGGGDGLRIWTGLTFQVSDVVACADEVVGGGGCLKYEPREEGGGPPHLAMCVDPDGNEFMISRRRSQKSVA